MRITRALQSPEYDLRELKAAMDNGLTYEENFASVVPTTTTKSAGTTYDWTLTQDKSLELTVSDTNGTAISLVGLSQLAYGSLVRMRIRNTSGSAAWALTLSSDFLTAGGAVPTPANNTSLVMVFYYDGTDLVEQSRAVDVA